MRIDESNARARVLLVDDDELVLAVMEDQLRSSCDCCIASDGFRALDLLAERDFDVIVSDQVMPGMSGNELLATTHELWPLTERILITGYADLNSVVKAVNDGQISYYLSKPWTAANLREAVQMAFQKVLDRRIQGALLEHASNERGQALQALEDGRQFLKELAGLQNPSGPRLKNTGARAHLLRNFHGGDPALIEYCESDG